ncbi:hypothetical protein KZX46_22170 (plasmid) [Polymorphobacter sp. PAMC 29334]|nr:hypothetical protein KZX46_22170 [Polymorphobacter sp. PAMC 29334]
MGSSSSSVVLFPNRSLARSRTETRSPIELREYGVGAQFLVELGIHHAVLLTNAVKLFVSIPGFRIDIVERRGIPERPHEPIPARSRSANPTPASLSKLGRL